MGVDAEGSHRGETPARGAPALHQPLPSLAAAAAGNKPTPLAPPRLDSDNMSPLHPTCAPTLSCPSPFRCHLDSAARIRGPPRPPPSHEIPPARRLVTSIARTRSRPAPPAAPIAPTTPRPRRSRTSAAGGGGADRGRRGGGVGGLEDGVGDVDGALQRQGPDGVLGEAVLLQLGKLGEGEVLERHPAHHAHPVDPARQHQDAVRRCRTPTRLLTLSDTDSDPDTVGHRLICQTPSPWILPASPKPHPLSIHACPGSSPTAPRANRAPSRPTRVDAVKTALNPVHPGPRPPRHLPHSKPLASQRSRSESRNRRRGQATGTGRPADRRPRYSPHLRKPTSPLRARRVTGSLRCAILGRVTYAPRPNWRRRYSVARHTLPRHARRAPYLR